MTAIVFHDGKLIADRKQVTLVSPVQFTDGPKIFVSKDKQFAYGVSGHTLNEGTCLRLEKSLRTLIEFLIVTDKDVFKVSDALDVPKIEGATSTTFMTRDFQYGFIEMGSKVRRLDGRSHSIGTGGTLLVGMLRCGMSLKEAIKMTASLDPLTGVDLDIIHANKLKPFVIGSECP